MNLRMPNSHRRRPRVAFVLLDEDCFPIESEELDEDDAAPTPAAPTPATIIDPPHVRARSKG